MVPVAASLVLRLTGTMATARPGIIPAEISHHSR